MTDDGDDDITMTGLSPQQQLALAHHRQATTLADWHPHVARALDAQALRDTAEAEREHARAEAYRAVADLVRHRAAIGAYVVVLLAWGVGGAAWATGITVLEVRQLLPSLTWSDAVPLPGPEESPQP